jgi:hypothetical protein
VPLADGSERRFSNMLCAARSAVAYWSRVEFFDAAYPLAQCQEMVKAEEGLVEAR